MQQNKWDIRFIEMAELVSSWSRDPSTRVGSVIVDKGNKVLSLGYNGFPSGLNDDPDLYLDRDYKLKVTIHSELNAILTCKHDVEGAIIYTTHQPCMACASVIIQKKLSGVIWKKSFADGRWGDSKDLFTQAGINFKEIGE